MLFIPFILVFHYLCCPTATAFMSHLCWPTSSSPGENEQYVHLEICKICLPCQLSSLFCVSLWRWSTQATGQCHNFLFMFFFWQLSLHFWPSTYIKFFFGFMFFFVPVIPFKGLCGTLSTSVGFMFFFVPATELFFLGGVLRWVAASVEVVP